MRFAELERHEILGISAGIDELLRPFKDVNDARILEGERARPQFAVILLAELAQQSLAEDIGAGEGTIAHALSDGCDAGGLRLLHEIEELRLRELGVRGQLDA